MRRATTENSVKRHTQKNTVNTLKQLNQDRMLKYAQATHKKAGREKWRHED